MVSAKRSPKRMSGAEQSALPPASAQQADGAQLQLFDDADSEAASSQEGALAAPWSTGLENPNAATQPVSPAASRWLRKAGPARATGAATGRHRASARKWQSAPAPDGTCRARAAPRTRRCGRTMAH